VVPGFTAMFSGKTRIVALDPDPNATSGWITNVKDNIKDAKTNPTTRLLNNISLLRERESLSFALIIRVCGKMF